MVVLMEERASEEQVQHVVAQLIDKGFYVHRSTGQLHSVLGAVGGNRSFDTRLIEVMEGVHEVLRITEPYKLASRTFKPDNTAVSFGDFRVGGDEVIAPAIGRSIYLDRVASRNWAVPHARSTETAH